MTNILELHKLCLIFPRICMVVTLIFILTIWKQYRTDFWTLWEKARVVYFERTASKHVYYQAWNRSPAQVGCMRQVFGPGGLGRPRGMGWRGRWEGGSGWGIHVTPWLIHVNVWQKPLQYCKVISLQLIKINGKKKVETRAQIEKLCQDYTFAILTHINDNDYTWSGKLVTCIIRLHFQSCLIMSSVPQISEDKSIFQESDWESQSSWTWTSSVNVWSYPIPHPWPSLSVFPILSLCWIGTLFTCWIRV